MYGFTADHAVVRFASEMSARAVGVEDEGEETEDAGRERWRERGME